MLLEWIQNANLHDSKHATPPNTHKPLLPAPAGPVRGYLCNDGDSLSMNRRGSLGVRSKWSILGPAARILTGGVQLVNSTVLTLKDGLSEDERARNARMEERRLVLILRMKNAESMEHWQGAAKELDVLEDNEAWKFDSTSSEFDATLIEARLKQLDDARINCDIKAMLSLIRTALSRDLGGMTNVRLYKHSHIGTKDLIERYIDSTLDTVRSLVETSKYSLPGGLETKDILEQVVYARQAFGRSALLLSGGATFGMNHVGVLKALFEAKLLPRIISGASAGSIVCAVLCTRTDEEIPDLLRDFPHGNLAVFEENGNEEGVIDRMRRLLTQGAWIDIKHLTQVMQQLIGDMTFQEAYNRTRRILNICVSSASVYELPRLLNYVTAPNVMIWSAVAASCSVPLLFSAAQLLVKNPMTGENTPWNPTPQRWIDGSVDNDLPMTRLAEMFNVNHFIVSQVNPHVVPFLVKDDKAISKGANSDIAPGPGWVYTLTNLAKDEALHRMQVLAELGIFPNLVSKARSVLSQKYSGDITILPELEYKDFPRILKNPTAEFMVQTCLCGERATWPKLSRVRNHCAVELELDAAVQTLRARVVFSPSQVNLRRMTTGVARGSAGTIGRKRRESGSAVQHFSKVEKEGHDQPLVGKATSKSHLRTSSSHWNIIRRHAPSLSLGSSHSANASPHPTPHSRDADTDKNYFNLIAPKRKDPDPSSAGDTTHSPPSSDADIDSHTDDSSPGSDSTVPGLGMFHASPSINPNDDRIDFFSSSQPVTSSTDRILATSPSSPRGAFGSLIMSPVSTREKEEDEDWVSVPTPSSPERRYKNLFHPTPLTPQTPQKAPL